MASKGRAHLFINSQANLVFLAGAVKFISEMLGFADADLPGFSWFAVVKFLEGWTVCSSQQEIHGQMMAIEDVRLLAIFRQVNFITVNFLGWLLLRVWIIIHQTPGFLITHVSTGLLCHLLSVPNCWAISPMLSGPFSAHLSTTLATGLAEFRLFCSFYYLPQAYGD